MKSVYKHLTERSAPISKTELTQCQELFELARHRQSVLKLDVKFYSGCDVDTILKDGRTALIIGVQSTEGDWFPSQVHEFISKHNPNLDIQDDYDRTALHYATMKDSKQIVEILIKAGAKKDIKDHLGNTPEFYAGRDTKTLLTERSAPITKTELKPREEIEGGLYVAEVQGKHIVLFDHVSYEAVDFKTAKNSTPENEYSDWRLPTTAELLAVCKEFDMFPKGWYWTGELFNHYMANSVLLPNGEQDIDGIDKKLYKLYVRSFDA